LKSLVALGAAPMASGIPILSRAAEQYPTKPVRVLVGTAPGGVADFMARLFAQQATEQLGQSFIVENRGGASGTLAAAYVARAPADGYTLLATTPTVMIVAPYMFPGLTFSPSRDFVPVCLLGAGPMVLVVNAKVPVRSVAELVEYARARPGQVAFASGGNGSAGHLTGELFASQAGLKLLHVPYKGDGEAALDVVGGQVPMMFSVMSVLGPHIKSGMVRALGVASATRMEAYPDIPTMAEAGVAGVDSLAWVAIYGPRGTPASVVEPVNAAWQKARAKPAVAGQINSVAMAHLNLAGPAQLGEFQQSEASRWGNIIRATGVTVVTK
jgi:tripartite-type tricarboxylate transporter receptor subunit TctC